MAPPEKVTAEQKAYLMNLVDDFLEVKKQGAFAKFWASTYQGWFKLWPEGEDTGILEEVQRKKALAATIDARQQYIKSWFRNHAVRKAKAPKEVKTVKLPKRKRAPQLLEVYSDQYYSTRVASQVAAIFDKENPPEGERLKVIRAEVDKAFQSEPPEVKEQITAQHAKILEESAANRKRMAGPQAPTPESYETGIRSISAHFDIFEEQVASSGWSFVLLAGGPDPMNAGRISTVAFHSGKNILGLTHSQYDPNFMRAHVPAFKRFLQTCYTPEDCDDRALNKAATTGDTTNGSATATSESSRTPTPASPAPSSSPVLTTTAITPLVNARPTVKLTQGESRVNVVLTPPATPPVDAAVDVTQVIPQSPMLGPPFPVDPMVFPAEYGDMSDMADPTLWDGFNVAAALDAMNARTVAGFNTYPSLMQELAAPLPDLFHPLPNFPYTFTTDSTGSLTPDMVMLQLDNAPIANASNADAPIVPNAPVVSPLPVLNNTPTGPAAGTKASASRKAGSKARASGKRPGNLDPPLPVPNDEPTVPNDEPPLSNNEPTVPNDEPAVPNDEPPLSNNEPAVPNDELPVPNNASMAPTVPNDGNDTPTVPPAGTKARASQKRPRSDDIDLALIVSTKRCRKIQTRTEIEALTDKLTKEKKENRRPRR